MRPRWLYRWFAFGVFASWASALFVSTPSTGRWAGEEAVFLVPLLSLLPAVTATAPLFLRTLLSRHRTDRRRFAIPLALGLSHAPAVAATMWFAEIVCQSPPPVAVAMLGWPVMLGEFAFRACRVE